MLVRVIIVFLLFASFLHAEYPLGKVAEFQLPGAHPRINWVDCQKFLNWDVQHWMSDSTYGWIRRVPGSTSLFEYCINTDIGDVQSFVSVYSAYTPLIVGSATENPVVVLVNYYCNFDDYGASPSLVNVTNGHRLTTYEPLEVYAGQDSWIAALGNINFQVWPPPPYSDACLISGLTANTCYETAFYSAEYHYGVGFLIHLSQVSQGIAGCPSISPFGVYDALSFATSDYYLSHWRDDTVPDPTTSVSSIGRLGIYDMPADSHYQEIYCQSDTSNCGGTRPVVAQIDRDGTRRVLHDGQCFLINANNEYIASWYNDDLRYGYHHPAYYVFSATLDTFQNEVFVKNNGNRLFLYDAATGTFIDSTSLLEGTLQYLIKLPGKQTEYVTLDDATDIVRIYKPTIGLTLHVLADSNSLQLNWYPVAGAASYTVWLRHNPPFDGPYFIGTTAETSMTIPVPEEDHGFFTVEVNY